MIFGDLWIGRWITQDMLKHGWGWVLRVPILLIVVFFGPAGFFVYMLFRSFRLKTLFFEA